MLSSCFWFDIPHWKSVTASDSGRHKNSKRMLLRCFLKTNFKCLLPSTFVLLLVFQIGIVSSYSTDLHLNNRYWIPTSPMADWFVTTMMECSTLITFMSDPSALFYYDDVEDPFGSSATIHKLGLFYFTLWIEPHRVDLHWQVWYWKSWSDF